MPEWLYESVDDQSDLPVQLDRRTIPQTRLFLTDVAPEADQVLSLAADAIVLHAELLSNAQVSEHWKEVGQQRDLLH